MWPTLDANTLIVTPLAVRADGRDVICPPAQFRRTVPAGGGVRVRHAPETAASAQHTPRRSYCPSLGVSYNPPAASYRPCSAQVDASLENLRRGKAMTFSSDHSSVDRFFADGHDDALRYIRSK